MDALSTLKAQYDRECTVQAVARARALGPARATALAGPLGEDRTIHPQSQPSTMGAAQVGKWTAIVCVI